MYTRKVKLLMNWKKGELDLPGVVDVRGVRGVPGTSKSSWFILSDQCMVLIESGIFRAFDVARVSLPSFI